MSDCKYYVPYHLGHLQAFLPNSVCFLAVKKYNVVHFSSNSLTFKR